MAGLVRNSGWSEDRRFRRYVAASLLWNQSPDSRTVPSLSRIGEIHAVDLSVAHDYHAVSLIRRILGVGFENAFFTGKRFTFPVLETAGRGGVVENGQVKDSYRIRMDIEFDSGKMGFYDFDKIQYHSLIRGTEIRIQGDRGELSGNYFMGKSICRSGIF